jgi:hygromycin-B 4-O-kinase
MTRTPSPKLWDERSGAELAEGTSGEGVVGAMTAAQALLRARFAPDATILRTLYGGFFSRAFAFAASGKEYVLRLSTAPQAAESFAKDAYAGRHFATASLHIPEVFLVGTTGVAAEQFAVSALVPGRALEAADAAARRLALPPLLDTIDMVGRVAVGGSRGFGMWDETGDAPYDSWAAFLSAADQNDTKGYYRDWHTLFAGMLERDLFDAVYRRMRQLLVHIPEVRGLSHNDLWFQNILADGARITGVIDWGNALYGDPFYDIARLSWGAEWWYADGRELLAARYGALPGFATRLACYQCHLDLDDLRFNAKNGKAADYGRTRERLLALIAAPVEE